MVSFGEKVKMKKAGNLNYGCSYVITSIFENCLHYIFQFFMKKLKMKRKWTKKLNLSPGFSEQKCFIQVNFHKHSCHILGMEWKNECF